MPRKTQKESDAVEAISAEPCFEHQASLDAFILRILELSPGFCMDVEEERTALADVLAVEICRAFRLHPIEVREPSPGMMLLEQWESERNEGKS